MRRLICTVASSMFLSAMFAVSDYAEAFQQDDEPWIAIDFNKEIDQVAEAGTFAEQRLLNVVNASGELLLSKTVYSSRKVDDRLLVVSQEGVWIWSPARKDVITDWDLLERFLKSNDIDSPAFYLFGETLLFTQADNDEPKWGSFHSDRGFQMHEDQVFNFGYFHEINRDTRLLPALSRSENRWGFVNKKLDWVLGPKYRNVYAFTESRALVETAEDSFCYIDEDGNVQSSIEFTPVMVGSSRHYIHSYYKNGYALVAIDENLKYLDLNGRIAFQDSLLYEQFAGFSAFSEGMAAAVTADRKIGFIDSNGRIKISPKWDKIDAGFFGGMAIVGLDGQRQVIDKSSRVLEGTLESFNPNLEKFLGDGLSVHRQPSEGVIVARFGKKLFELNAKDAWARERDRQKRNDK